MTKPNDNQQQDLLVNQQTQGTDADDKQSFLLSMLDKLGYANEDHAVLKAKKARLGDVKSAEIAKIQKIFEQDIAKITEMLQQGKINQDKAVELAKKVKEAFDKKISEVDSAIDTYGKEISGNINNIILDKYKEANPEFFNNEANNEIVNQFLATYGHVSAEDLDFIARAIDLIRTHEQKNQSEKVKNVNSEAISKMVSNVSLPASSSTPATKVFSLKEISKMSAADFKKYEKIIFEQASKGLIK